MAKNEIYQAAIDTWGAETQITMVFEEMSELQKELCKALRGKANIPNIAEEIADVEIMLEQMKLLFKCETEEIKLMKLKRLENRIVTAVALERVNEE